MTGIRPYPDVIEFSFTEQQRPIHDARKAARSKQDFDLSVRLWPDGPAVPATAHLRGKGSLGCERSSYTLDLDTGTPRYLLPDSATDEFYLLSMCLDDRYVRAHTVYRLLGNLGLFPLAFRFVELRLDGASGRRDGPSAGRSGLHDTVGDQLADAERRSRGQGMDDDPTHARRRHSRRMVYGHGMGSGRHIHGVSLWRCIRSPTIQTPSIPWSPSRKS